MVCVHHYPRHLLYVVHGWMVFFLRYLPCPLKASVKWFAFAITSPLSLHGPRFEWFFFSAIFLSSWKTSVKWLCVRHYPRRCLTWLQVEWFLSPLSSQPSWSLLLNGLRSPLPSPLLFYVVPRLNGFFLRFFLSLENSVKWFAFSLAAIRCLVVHIGRFSFATVFPVSSWSFC